MGSGDAAGLSVQLDTTVYLDVLTGATPLGRWKAAGPRLVSYHGNPCPWGPDGRGDSEGWARDGGAGIFRWHRGWRIRLRLQSRLWRAHNRRWAWALDSGTACSDPWRLLQSGRCACALQLHGHRHDQRTPPHKARRTAAVEACARGSSRDACGTPAGLEEMVGLERGWSASYI